MYLTILYSANMTWSLFEKVLCILRNVFVEGSVPCAPNFEGVQACYKHLLSMITGLDIPVKLLEMTAIFILQSFEAIVFEVLADQCGRRWPVVINMFLVVVLGLQSGFCSNIPKCLGVRACVESPGE